MSMQKNNCLYHQLKDKKKKQKSLSNSSKLSNKQFNKFNEKSFLQSNRKHLPTQKVQQFNDYTLYPPTKQNSKRIKFCSNQTFNGNDYSRNVTFVDQNKHKKASSRDYSFNQIKSVKSDKSHKQKLSTSKQSQNHIDNSFQQKVQHFLKIFCDQKIQNLENKIVSLTLMMQKCQNDTTKNHYEFFLLRDIVQKLKIQNIQLSSKINAKHDFPKINKKFALNLLQQPEDSYNERPQLEIIKQDEQSKMRNIILEEKSLNIFNQYEKNQNQTNFNEESTSSQKFENNIYPNNVIDESFNQISKKISQIIGKQVINLNKEFQDEKIKFNLKKNKPKKILHFQNTLKQQKLIQDKKIKEEQQIQNLLKKESQRQINENFSLVISSEENLLQSVELKKFQNRAKIKVTYQNQINNLHQQEIQNSFFVQMVKEGNNSLKQIQSQMNKFHQILQVLNKKQKIFTFDEQKLNEVRSQKQRIFQVLQKLKRNYIKRQYQ